MKKNLITYIGIISLVFGCSEYEIIDPQKSWHYVFDPETKTVYYRTPPSGGTATFRNNHAKLATYHPKKWLF